ncbi:alpha/beta hydrolase [Nostoc sp. CHAB 5844]|nr:alpha/beta hydrolase [Nostoc sp. CHAB 5844]
MNADHVQQVEVGGISIVYRLSGPVNGAQVVLVTGFGDQLVEWPDSLVDGLTGEGYRVLAYEPRDSGLSGSDPAWPTFDGGSLMAIATGQGGAPAYTLDDLAQELIALCEVLGWTAPHLIGYSMGGMIAQRAALQAPFASLTLLFSTSGSPGLSQAGPELVKASFALTQPLDAEMRLAAGTQLVALTNGSRHGKAPAEATREITALQLRAYRPEGVGRMMAALLGSQPAHEQLQHLRLPCLVLQAAEDGFFAADHGHDLVARIPRSQLVTIAGAGHNLPESLGGEIASTWLRFASAVPADTAD